MDRREVLEQIVNEELLQLVLSNATDPAKGTKCKIRPVRIKGEIYFQETMYLGTQVFHSNRKREECIDRLEELLGTRFRQAAANCTGEDVTILVSKKGKVTVKRRKKAQEEALCRRPELEHNRTKQYILQDGKPVDFLVGLGVQSPDGKVTKAYYDKFRQINRYLEFIEDVCDKLPTGRTIRIIDFGCGKSYLTFAMYYYLHVLQGRDIRVTGLDLKADVIRHCNELAQKLQYTKLDFLVGDIKHYEGEDSVDMVVSLHACDTATDYALEKAVKWGAKVIMAVPCCQHELNRQIKNELFAPVLRYGIVKERMAALLTDALRADLLEQQGYDTQILEFIDMEHTPKNLLIRAVKSSGMRSPKRDTKTEELMEFLQVHPILKDLL
ncbi:MAG: class I SAM-dependent methyltransferase [Acetatifactor sp.]